MSNAPLSEQFRLVAKQWVEADAAANLLEETKSAVLAQRMTEYAAMPVNRAEIAVKASPEWHEFVGEMVAARERANLLKVKLEYIKMRFQEWQSAEASKRAEMRL